MVARVALLGDGATNGAAVSVANSGQKAGNPVDSVAVGAGAALTWDTSRAFLGNASMAVSTPGTGTNSYARYDSMYRPTSGGDLCATLWLYFAALPAATMDIFYVADFSNTRMLQVRLTNTGKIRAYDAGNITIVTMSTTIATGQWIRVDVLYTPHASAGKVQLKLYNTPTNSTPTESTTQFTAQNLRTTDAFLHFIGVQGAVANAAYNVQAYLSDTGPAPFGAGLTMSRWVGGVTATSAQVAAKVLGASTVRLKVSTASDLSASPVYSSSAAPDSDGTVRLTVTGLTANTQYHYGLEVDSQIDTAINGKFRTMPTAGAPASFTFSAASCAANNYNGASLDLARSRVGADGQPPLMFFMLGDLRYDNVATNDPHLFHQVYDRVASSDRYARLLAETATIYTWSDHDSVGSNGDRTGASWPACWSVYRSRVPHHPFASTDSHGIYHSFAAGRVKFIVTDGRTYMDPANQTDDAAKTKLGATQKAWLLSELADPTYPLKIWVHEDAWENGPNYSGDDSWNVYSAEAAEIAAHILTNRINVAYVAGDLHLLAADDGTNTGGFMPVHQCAALRGTSFIGNGTYSAGRYPTSDGTTMDACGFFDLIDTGGGTITLAYQGVTSDGTTRVSQTTVFDVSTPAPANTTPQAITSDGATPVWNEAVDGDKLTPVGTTVLTVRNQRATPITLTINPPGKTTYNVAKPSKVWTIPAGADRDILLHPEFPDPADQGRITLVWSATQSVTWAAKRI